jgi:hypothetical protein
MTKLKENAVRIGTLNVPYKPQEVHRHLVTLPTGGRFAIFDPPEPTARSLERLLVFDAHKLLKVESTREAKRTVIGTVRLLPGAGGTTDIVSDAKDAVWGQEITGEKRALFYEYFQLVRAHFGVSESCSASIRNDAARGGDVTTTEAGTDNEPERLPHPTIRERRERVKTLTKDGRTDREIAHLIPCSESTVRRDRKALGLKKKNVTGS